MPLITIRNFINFFTARPHMTNNLSLNLSLLAWQGIVRRWQGKKLVYTAILLWGGLISYYAPSLYGQEAAVVGEDSAQLAATNAATAENTATTISNLLYKRPKLVSNIDFFLSVTAGVGGKNPNILSSLAPLAERRPQTSTSPADSVYQGINRSVAVPYSIGIDLYMYYRFFGLGLGYQRLNSLSGVTRSGVRKDPTNTNTTTFNNYNYAYAYNYSLITDGFSLEFHLRQPFITQRVHLLWGIGYLYHTGKLQTEITTLDQSEPNIETRSTAVSSHGVIIRLEMNFLFSYFLLRTGFTMMNFNFPTQDLYGIPIRLQSIVLMPYISLGVAF